MNREEVFEIIKEIESGKTIDEVARKNRVLPERMRAYLLQYGGLKGKEILKKEISDKLPVSIEEIINKFNEGKKATTISDEIGVKYNDMIQLLLMYEAISGEKIQKKSNSHNRIDNLNEEEIIKEYSLGKGILKIAEDNGVSATPIRRIIDKHKQITGEDLDKKHKKSIEKIRQRKKIEKEGFIDKTKEEFDKKIKLEAEKINLLEKLIREHKSYEQAYKILEENGYGEISKLQFYQLSNKIMKESKREIDEER